MATLEVGPVAQRANVLVAEFSLKAILTLHVSFDRLFADAFDVGGAHDGGHRAVRASVIVRAVETSNGEIGAKQRGRGRRRQRSSDLAMRPSLSLKGTLEIFVISLKFAGIHEYRWRGSGDGGGGWGYW